MTGADTIRYLPFSPALPHTGLLSQGPTPMQPPPVEAISQSSDNAPECRRGDTTPEDHQQLIDKGRVLCHHATSSGLSKI